MRLLATVFAIASGIIVLLGYFYPIPLLLQLRVLLTNWAIIIAATTVLIGIYNLMAVHAEKIRGGEKGSANSWVLIISLILTIAYLIYAVFSLDLPHNKTQLRSENNTKL
jgi:amino acid transporter